VCNPFTKYPSSLEPSHKRYRFSPKLRILAASVYQRTLNTKRAATNRTLELFCYDAGYCYPRLGIVVGKKMLKRAVDRNYFKRIIRESFRHLANQLISKDYVVRLRFAVSFDRSQLLMIRKEADDLFVQFLKKENLPSC